MNANRFDGFESLESRLMLDGNLTAAMLGDVLDIQGDGLDNSFELRQFDAQQFFIFGQDTLGGPTFVNGLPQQLFTDIKSIQVSLGNGNDTAFFNGDLGQGAMREIVIVGDLLFAGGKGSDNFLTEDIKVRGNVTVHSGAGNDFVQLIDTTVVKETRLNGQQGADLLATFRSTFRDNVFFNGGDGPDRVLNGSGPLSLEGSTFHNDLRINLGEGKNELEIAGPSVLFSDLNILGGDQVDDLSLLEVKLREGDIRIDTKGEDDIVSLVNVRGNANADSWIFQTGVGNDELFFEEVDITDPDALLRVFAGEGDDTVRVVASNIGAAGTVINAGEGEDVVEIDKSRIQSDETTVVAGGGDDSLFIVDSFFDIYTEVRVDGGRGNDTLDVENSRFAGDEGHVGLGEGDDQLFVVDSFFDVFTELTIDGGGGNDILDVKDTRFKGAGEGLIRSGAGDDRLKFTNVKLDLSKLLINAGIGNDVIRIDQTRSLQNAGELRLRGGVDDDTIRVLDSILVTFKKIIVDMEDGDDRLLFEGDNSVGPLTGRRFLGGPGDDIALPPARGEYFFDEFESFRTLSP